MKALLDGDIVCYRCAFAAEHTVYTLRVEGQNTKRFKYKKDLDAYVNDNEIEEYEVEKERVVEPVSHAIANVNTTLKRIRRKLNTEDVDIYLSDSNNFRDAIEIGQKYKGNRDNQKRPHWYKEVKQYLIDSYGAKKIEGLEADDVLANEQDSENLSTVVVSLDKDLLQIPGLHYNWVKDEKLNISPDTARYIYWCQVLTGDRTDNIPGIKGVGPKTAAKILEGCKSEEEFYNKVVEQYTEKVGETIELERTVPIEEYIQRIQRLIKVGS